MKDLLKQVQEHIDNKAVLLEKRYIVAGMSPCDYIEFKVRDYCWQIVYDTQNNYCVMQAGNVKPIYSKDRNLILEVLYAIKQTEEK